MIVVLPAAAGAMLPADAPCQLSPPPPPAVPARPRVGTPPEPQPEPEPATAAAPTEQPKSFARPLPPVPAAAAAPLPAPAQQVMAGASYKLLFMGVVQASMPSRARMSMSTLVLSASRHGLGTPALSATSLLLRSSGEAW